MMERHVTTISGLILVLLAVLMACDSRVPGCGEGDVRKEVLVGAAHAVFSMMSEDADFDADAMRYELPSPHGGNTGDLVFEGSSLTLAPDDATRGGTFQLRDISAEAKDESTRTCAATFVMIGGNPEFPLRYTTSSEGPVEGSMETPRGTIQFGAGRN